MINIDTINKFTVSARVRSGCCIPMPRYLWHNIYSGVSAELRWVIGLAIPSSIRGINEKHT